MRRWAVMWLPYFPLFAQFPLADKSLWSVSSWGRTHLACASGRKPPLFARTSFGEGGLAWLYFRKWIHFSGTWSFLPSWLPASSLVFIYSIRMPYMSAAGDREATAFAPLLFPPLPFAGKRLIFLWFDVHCFALRLRLLCKCCTGRERTY